MRISDWSSDVCSSDLAIEELLRYLTVVHLIILRIATEDIEIGGVTIPAGEGIIPLNFAANRDDGHFPDAAKFDIRRRPRDHAARSEERRVGNACVSKCRSRWRPDPEQQQNKQGNTQS